MRLSSSLKRVAKFASVFSGGSLFHSVYLFCKYIVIVFSLKICSKSQKINLEYGNVDFSIYISDRMDLVAVEESFVLREYDFPYHDDIKIIVDLGANIGDTSIYYSIRYPKAKIFSVEPNPEIYKRLCKNTHYFKNIVPLNFAISDFTGKQFFYLYKSHLGSSLNSRSDKDEKITVEALTFPDFLAQQGIDFVDILKFDIEGGESYLLKRDHLQGRVGCLVGEIHTDLITTSEEDMLVQLSGYEIKKLPISEKRYIIYGTNE